VSGRLAGLRRYMWKEPHGTSAVCMAPDDTAPFCTWAFEGLSPETTAAKAREHTRETRHDTRVNYHQIVEYSRD
jgi:hypothetical protein